MAPPAREPRTGIHARDHTVRASRSNHVATNHPGMSVTSNVSVHETPLVQVIVMTSVPDPPSEPSSGIVIALLPWQLAPLPLSCVKVELVLKWSTPHGKSFCGVSVWFSAMTPATTSDPQLPVGSVRVIASSVPLSMQVVDPPTQPSEIPNVSTRTDFSI